MEGPRGARWLRRRAVGRCAAGRGADRVCGHDRARERGAWPLTPGPQARHSAADRGSRIAQRRGRRGADPVRDPAAETRGMSDPSEMSQALAAIGQAQSNTELERIELEYLGRKSGKVSAM